VGLRKPQRNFLPPALFLHPSSIARHHLKEARLALTEEKQANLAIFHQGVATFEESRKSLRNYAAAVQASIPALVVPLFPLIV
jgi:hypothetical protein